MRRHFLPRAGYPVIHPPRWTNSSNFSDNNSCLLGKGTESPLPPLPDFFPYSGYVARIIPFLFSIARSVLCLLCLVTSWREKGGGGGWGNGKDHHCQRVTVLSVTVMRNFQVLKSWWHKVSLACTQNCASWPVIAAYLPGLHESCICKLANVWK